MSCERPNQRLYTFLYRRTWSMGDWLCPAVVYRHHLRAATPHPVPAFPKGNNILTRTTPGIHTTGIPPTLPAGSGFHTAPFTPFSPAAPLPPRTFLPLSPC